MKKFSILFLILFGFAVSMGTFIVADDTNDDIVEFMIQEQSVDTEELESVKSEKPDIYPSLFTAVHFSTLSLGKPASVLTSDEHLAENSPFEPPRN